MLPFQELYQPCTSLVSSSLQVFLKSHHHPLDPCSPHLSHSLADSSWLLSELPGYSRSTMAVGMSSIAWNLEWTSSMDSSCHLERKESCFARSLHSNLRLCQAAWSYFKILSLNFHPLASMPSSWMSFWFIAGAVGRNLLLHHPHRISGMLVWSPLALSSCWCWACIRRDLFSSKARSCSKQLACLAHLSWPLIYKTFV